MPTKNPDTPLRLRILTKDGRHFDGTVDVDIRHRRFRQDGVVRRGLDASEDIDVEGLRRAPDGDYQITVTPTGNFRPQGQFFNIPASGMVTLDFVFEGEDDQGTTPGVTTVDDDLPGRYFVSGTVASRERAGVGGLRVEIVDKNVGGDVSLDLSLKTDERGRYSGDFDADVIRERGKLRPDLQVRVFNGATFVGASDVRYDAGERETIDVLLPPGSGALAPEHATLSAAIGQHSPLALRQLQENDDRQDITYLANKTGWDARAVAMAALADQFSVAHALPNGERIRPDVYYALFRAGLPASAAGLFKTDARTIDNVLRKSVADGIVGLNPDDDIPRAVDTFTRISARERLDAEPTVGVSKLTDVLAVSQLGGEEQRVFSRLLTQHGNDPDRLWPAIRQALPEAAPRLELNGRLSSLTINNAPLIRAIHERLGDTFAPAQLAAQGFHRSAAWQSIFNANTPIPQEIPGETTAERRENYASYLAAQVRVSYPTASIAQVYQSSLPDPNGVSQFLLDHQDEFVLGVQPVEQFRARKNIAIDAETLSDIKSLQRIHQITPNDDAMTALLKTSGEETIRSAHDVVSLSREDFVATYAARLGGEPVARAIYDKSVQVENATLNIAVSFLQARNGVRVGQPNVDGSGGIVAPAPAPPTGANANDIVAYPTLEQLFGSMDYCACNHCRSVLSPAAYLVDLLQFIDRPKAGAENPQSVLFARRPDIRHLPLTCENTNTAMKYIDVVNETLEYFIANDVRKLSLDEYKGQDTNGSASEDLLAAPPFVMEAAYTILKDEPFPPPLPFHRQLEFLRACCEKLEVPLALAMERLRKSEKLDDTPYGWRDVLLEGLRLSRTERDLLTDRVTFPLRRLYGFPTGTTDATVIATLSNAKTFSRRTGVSYDDLVAILRTRFVNPTSDLIPRFERLTAPVRVIVGLKAGNADAIAEFEKGLPKGGGTLDPAEYGGNIRGWATDDKNFDRLMKLIVLSQVEAGADACDFGTLELRRAKPPADANDVSTRLDDVAFVRLIRFIRLWRKLGWTIEQTDAAICALWNADGRALSDDDVDTLPELDEHFAIVVPRLGVVRRVLQSLGLSADRGLLPLLAFWSDIGTNGERSLYRQLFLNPTVLARDTVFVANINGEYLKSGAALAVHAETVRSALNLTGSDYDEIIRDRRYDAVTTVMTLAVVSDIFRYGWLARALRLSVRELLEVRDVTGIDPFARPDFSATPPEAPPIVRFIEFVQTMRERSMKLSTALYLIWNVDLSGKSAPAASDVEELARALRNDFADSDRDFAAAEDPEGNLARARTAVVYGAETAAQFFELLDGQIRISVPYIETETDETRLRDLATAIAGKVVHDAFAKRLEHQGLLSTTKRDELKALPAATPDFVKAVDALFARSEEAKGTFFTRHPELQKLFDDYVASPDPLEKKRAALLAAFQPELAGRRKRQQALQRVTAAAGTDLPMTNGMLNGTAAPFPLRSVRDNAKAALEDVLAVGIAGLAIAVFHGPTATGAPDRTIAASAILEYAPAANPLPQHPTAGMPISGKWRGRIETVDAGYHNFSIDADAAVTRVTLSIGGTDRPLTRSGTAWRNLDAIELKGATLYDVELRVDNVKDVLSVKWESPKRPREVIPSRYLWPPGSIVPFAETYVRFLKVTALAEALRLTAAELTHFATAADFLIGGVGWLNALPVTGRASATDSAALHERFRGLLDFARIKAEVSPNDEQVLSALTHPGEAAQRMHWNDATVIAFRTHFTLNPADLGRLAQFTRMHDAVAIARTMGVAGAVLTKTITNDPQPASLSDFESALRGRHAPADWRAVVEPINDRMRGLQRDALVAYILHQFRSTPATAHIDTPDKLFEYFLMDVEMEPCMQTSRIRHALSSVQLFIERCLLNLERDVAAGLIESGPWVWMKRYRVWEANRKVFLFPENWLEPELRDDKSPYFKEVESELLQSDITDDSAAVAVLNYLAKLEEVAKLEPVGMCHVPADPDRHKPQVVHVVARTHGAQRKYFYRRREGLVWTPWEPIKLEIEGDPVQPAVWNGRLLLFWLRLVTEQENEPTLPRPGSGKISDLANESVPAKPEVKTKAILCWSEYYNGKWQAAKTSDPNQPIPVNHDVRKAFRLQALPAAEALRVNIDTQGGGNLDSSFLLFNTFGTPLGQVVEGKLASYSGDYRTLNFSHGGLYADYHGNLYDKSYFQMHRIIRSNLPMRALYQRTVSYNGTGWPDPFIEFDPLHAFYVTVEVRKEILFDLPAFEYATFRIPDLIAPPPLTIREPVIQIPVRPGWTEGTASEAVVEAGEMITRFLSEDVHIRQAIGANGTVTFGNVQIGPSGALKSGGKQ